MNFSKALLTWHKKHGRHNLPWQKNPTAYRVWISEIMLQQTQVATVIPYYQRFMKQFPSLKKLAAADLDDVLHLWTGLGYYARARNLHKTATIIQENYSGRFPKDLDIIQTLPGIGRSTAGAIASFAFNINAAIMDGNVKRVFARFFALDEYPGSPNGLKFLWEQAENLKPQKDINHYNQALMDLGAMVCSRSKPKCNICPLQSDCQSYIDNSTHIFPIKKQRTIRPTRKIKMLIIQQADHSIFLEKRPMTGIWGNLWSFPECDLTDDHLSHPRLLQQNIQSEQTLAILKHQFTHFSLEITPIILTVDNQLDLAEDNQYHWHTTGQRLPGGIPRPVEKLLNYLGPGLDS